MAWYTTSQAARALGVDPNKLRRWCREGKFDDLSGMRWNAKGSFQRRREFTGRWISAVGRRIDVKPDFSQIDN